MADSTRREFLTGQSLQSRLEAAGTELAGDLTGKATCPVPTAGERICLSQRSMACDFECYLNPGDADAVQAASEALHLVSQLEDQMTVYRPHSELSRLNARGAHEAVPVEPRLFDLLKRSVELSEALEGAFDPTSGPLVALWRTCRNEGRIPRDEELVAARDRVGTRFVQFDDSAKTIRFTRPGVEFNLGAIGKGYALDRAAEQMRDEGVADFLIHAARSSIVCRGEHNGLKGWPVGVKNPLFPEETLGTLVVKDRCLATSGNGIQFYRHEGVRYGHLLDPRTGWPVDSLLAVTVVAPTATEAEALSTAFFVLGVEKARQHCHNHNEVGAILIPPPSAGRRLEPILGGALPEAHWTVPTGV